MSHLSADHEHVCTVAQSIQPSAPTYLVAKSASTYKELLSSPFSAIASNVPERADATFAAILGYN